MVKNAIIIIQFLLLITIAIQKPSNIDLIVKDVVKTKNIIEKGSNYVVKSFEKEFSVFEEKKDLPNQVLKHSNDMEKIFSFQEEKK